jgi:predicted ATP-dependent serine protease
MQINVQETLFQKCSSIEIPESFYNRMQTGVEEIDRMFGTEYLPGLMKGSTITITATPGAGKSTLTAMISEMLFKKGYKSAIASGEESHQQIAYTCKRLGIEDVDVAHIKDVETIAEAMKHYDFLVVDSFQALRSKNNMKKKEFAQYAQDLLISTAKETGCVLVFILHITTQGLPKGGTDIIHAVDVNVKMTVSKEDESMRIIHVYKNRWGETKQYSAIMGSRGFDFQGVYESPKDDGGRGRPNLNQERKQSILEDLGEDITLEQVCDSYGVSGQIAGILLRELVGENKLKKIGRGANAVWRVVKMISEKPSCGVIDDALSSAGIE